MYARIGRALPAALVLVASLVLAHGAASAARAAPAAREDVSALLGVAGVDRSLAEFLAATRLAGLDGARLGADDDGESRALLVLIGDALDDAFSVERLRPIVVRATSAALDEDDVRALLAHHRSALGRRLRHASRERRPADAPAAYERFAAALGSRPGDAERLALLERYVRESGAAGLVARFLVETQITSLHAVAALDGQGGGWALEAGVKAALETQEPIRRELAARLPTLLAYTYAGFTHEELETMTAVELSDAGRRLTEGVFAGYREVAVAGNADFVRRIRAAMSFAEAGVGI